MAQKLRGAPRQFPYTADQLSKLFEQYKKETEDNTIVFPSFPDFCIYINVDIDTAEDTALNPVDTNKDVSALIKKIYQWCINQLFSNPNWIRKPVQAIYLSKQKFCGKCYTDKQEVKQDTKMEISVSFGKSGKVKDPFK